MGRMYCYANPNRDLTRPHSLTIFSHMKKETSKNIEDLEAKVEELLQLSQRLAQENAALKAQLQELKQDRSGLVEQKEQVRAQVESMIARLQAMESA